MAIAVSGGASVAISNSTAGENLRVEVDAGRGRNGVTIRVEIKDGAGTPQVLYEGPIVTGDGPVEWVGPEIPSGERGKKIRVRISDPLAGPIALDDSIGKVG